MPERYGSGSQSFAISNADKVLFPEARLSKRDLIRYYDRVAEFMLPHVRDRIATMQRFPDGIDGDGFYQKDVPDYFPDWIHTVRVETESGSLRQLTIDDKTTLTYLANQGCIVMHVWPSRSDAPKRPDRLIFDLDPAGDHFDWVRSAAREVREVLEAVGLASFVMTTGSNGLHVVSPLDCSADFEVVRDFAARVARFLAERSPERFTTEQRKNKRGERVFFDVLRNAYGQHSVAPYSVRPLPEAPVATPLDWQEVGRRSLHPRKYTIENLFRRLARKEDPWASIGRHAASIEKASRQLDEWLRARSHSGE